MCSIYNHSCGGELLDRQSTGIRFDKMGLGSEIHRTAPRLLVAVSGLSAYLPKIYYFDRETTPSQGEVSYLLCFLIKNPEEEDPPRRRVCTRCFEGGPLPPSSWSGNILNRNPPPGGKGSCDQRVCYVALVPETKTSPSFVLVFLDGEYPTFSSTEAPD